METEINLLGNVIEFSIGLGGFSGIVAVFMNRSRWTALERYRLINLLMAALVPAFASFIALGMLVMELDPVTGVWRLSCVILSVLVCGVIYTAYAGRNRMPPELKNHMRLRILVSINLLFTSVVAVNLFGASGVSDSWAFPAFYFGLIALLMGGVVLFGVAILSGSNRNSD